MNELGVVERRSSELEEEPCVNPAHLPLARPELQDCLQKVRLVLNDSFTDCDLSPGEVEAGGSGGQGRLGYIASSRPAQSKRPVSL